MPNWLPSAICSLIAFGLWGFFPKLAVSYLDHKSALVYQTLGGLLVGSVVFFSIKMEPAFSTKGVLFALLTGVAGVIGTLYFFAAAEKGKISLVVSVTALYPLITIILAAIFLEEPITIKHLTGMLFAVIAILLLST